MKTVSADSHQSLIQWVSQATGIGSFGVKVRLRGNDLHILCESRDCPRRWHTLSDLLQALRKTDLDALTSNDQPSIYQVFVYGRKKGDKRPQWCHKVYLNQLDSHLEQVSQALLVANASERAKIAMGGAIILSNESQAKKGDPEAIARYLSETLSSLGVSVMVQVKQQKPKDSSKLASNRLWIFCHSNYSPDPALIAEPVAQKLRALKLTGYQDAVIAAQIVGEEKPSFLLRVDLTPEDAMLKEWGRWGDVQAIAKLCEGELVNSKIAVTAQQKESTLHIFCTQSGDAQQEKQLPTKELCLKKIVPILEALAPQGLLAATIYGQKNTDSQPAWVDWLDLPATTHLAFAPTPLGLAASGDEPAIIFLLERLLNPDLSKRLLTGGIRVLLKKKGDLLHVMCDAPLCPQRNRVAKEVTDFLRQLEIPGISGVRVYGRRAGNKDASWQHGVDFETRQRLVPEASPEFAATSTYLNDLLPDDATEPFLRPDLTPEDVRGYITKVTQDWGVAARKFLLGTQLFMESDRSLRNTHEYQGMRVAFVWGAIGLLLTIQADWVLNFFLSQNQETANITRINPSNPEVDGGDKTASGSQSGDGKSVFNGSGFTNTHQKTNYNTSNRENGTAAAILLAARSQMPSFNARQLDEQLALYKQRLAHQGTPPDVLIIGSSRALRGIDPTALSKTLETQGFANLDIFNFGINGATAQVVDFIIRRVLEPAELPKMIVWADGSRAFNGGREDATFQAIAASPGYKQAMQKSIAEPGTVGEEKVTADNKEAQAKVSPHKALNDWLNEILASVSPTYKKRDQLKELLSEQLKSLPIVNDFAEKGTSDPSATSDDETSTQAVDFDGFLSLSIRFNPKKYYEKHPRVSGSYDNDYKSFLLGGEQDASLQALLKFTKARNIPVVFINMPLTTDYLDPIRTKFEQEFQQYMLRQAESSHFTFRDLMLLFPQRNELFSDPSHLNRYGAYEVSKKIATDPMIPWVRK